MDVKDLSITSYPAPNRGFGFEQVSFLGKRPILLRAEVREEEDPDLGRLIQARQVMYISEN